VANDTGEQHEVEQRDGPLAWLSKRVGLVVLVVIGAIVALRLMASWIKWLLIAVVIGALFYLFASRPSAESERE
jgi:uncharacterized membrane protein YfcA